MDNDNWSRRLLIWDLPTRFFHWVMALSFAAAWLAFDDDRYLYIHVYAGYVLFGLLCFRLIWGIIGSHYSRFHTFAHDWPSATAYLKGLLNGQAARFLGHNPAGSWAIFIILLLGLTLTLSGILTLGGEERHGPFAGMLSFETAHIFREIHEWSAWTMLAVVAMHVFAIVAESILKRENLIMAMITGYKEGGDSGVSVRPWGGVAVVLLLIIVLVSFFTFRGYLGSTEQKPYLPFVGIQLPENDTWREECSDCHMAYHPSLLPARSWQQMMQDQHDHFDDDLDLDDEVVTELLGFMRNNSAEKLRIEPSWRILRTLPLDQTPLRITETGYWKSKHDQIEQRYWDSDKVKSKGNCAACHYDAKAGTFEDAAMRMPHL